MTPEDVPGGTSLEQLVPLMRSLELRPPQPGLHVVSHRDRAADARTRTVTWSDPATVAALLGERDGVAGLEAIAAGQIPPPPVAELMGMEIRTVERGRVVFTLDPAEFLYNPIGSVHGGVLATLLDSAMGCAVQSVLPAGVRYTTLDLAVKYVRPVTVETGRVLAEGTIIHEGGRVCTAEGRVTSARDGRLLAHATTSCLVLREAAARPQAA